jgi:hypothetical protein
MAVCLFIRLSSLSLSICLYVCDLIIVAKSLDRFVKIRGRVLLNVVIEFQLSTTLSHIDLLQGLVYVRIQTDSFR